MDVSKSSPRNSTKDILRGNQLSDLYSEILDVTLSNSSSSSSSTSPTFLPDLAEMATDPNLGSRRSKPRLTRDNVDLAIIERLNLPFRRSPFRYFIDCYERSVKKSQEYHLINKVEQKESVRFIQHMLSAYACRLLDSEILSDGQRIRSFADFNLLMGASENERKFPKGFLADFVNDVDDPMVVFTHAIDKVTEVVRTGVSPTNNVGPLNCLLKLCRYPTTAKLILKQPFWCPLHINNGYMFAKDSIIGAFLMLGSSHPAIRAACFDTPKGDVKKIGKFQLIMSVLQERVFQVCDALVRADPKKQPKKIQRDLMKYIARNVQLNQKRTQLRFDPRQVAPDTFCINLAAVCLKLCTPIMHARKPKMKLLNPMWFIKNDLVDFSEVTRIGNPMDAKEVKEDGTQFKFVTEVFCLTLTCLAHCYIPCFESLRNMEHMLKRAERDGGAAFPPDHLDRIRSAIVGLRAHVHDPRLIKDLAEIYEYTSKWLLWLNNNNPSLLAAIPEFVISNIVDFFQLISRLPVRMRQGLIKVQMDSFFEFAVVFMSPDSPLKNFHLRAKFLEILRAYLPYRFQQELHANSSHVYITHPYLKKRFVAALCTVYVDVENTGRHNQYYEKFNFRTLVSDLFEFIWNYPVHKDALKHFASDEPDTYNRFINLLLNDSLFLLDEGLENLRRIRVEEQAISDNPDHDRGQLEQAERLAQSDLYLAKASVRMLSWLTGFMPDVFRSADFVDRIAKMIDSYFVKLAAKKRKELKVKNPEKYHFEPKYLLTEITKMFLNLATSDKFLQCVAEDKLSYDYNVFVSTSTILKGKGLLSWEQIQKFDTYVDRIEDMRIEIDDQEEMFEDAPFEFLDPIVNTLMKDPVKLPTSGNIMDRPTIKRILMDTGRDPFNRKTLEESQLEDQPDLQTKISVWKKEVMNSWREKKRAEAAANAQKEADGDEQKDESQ